jgi:flagellin
MRSTLGAQQNRLEFTINTLSIQEENSSSSESAIRDADMAKETMSFTRNQILVNAGTSILAQANSVPQTALQLLR